MLVLTRCPGESILVGDDVEVLVVSVYDQKVWLRVTASTGVPRVRDEWLAVDGLIRLSDRAALRVVSLRSEAGSRVRLGIVAPSEVVVVRKEIAQSSPASPSGKTNDLH